MTARDEAKAAAAAAAADEEVAIVLKDATIVPRQWNPHSQRRRRSCRTKCHTSRINRPHTLRLKPFSP